ncbi:hypothetical protein GUJ93_ZPchr0012g18871 [Zizania palustris]|uniref:HMA domain-containing protein n=1 Tax=Zizania palustris TaxID=103762 RepID=A0A8J5WPL6_ZIZPA|nr:hypothetical protein GUJ93_ZPchr0012g18871 [Zizania palustris]
MAPVILQMEVHCDGCARKIRKAAKKVRGVTMVTADVETGQVVVSGTADAAAIQDRLQKKLKRVVTIISTGVEEPPAAAVAAAPSASAAPPPPQPPAPPLPTQQEASSSSAPPPQQQPDGASSSTAPNQNDYYQQYYNSDGQYFNPHYTPSYFSDDHPTSNCTIL